MNYRIRIARQVRKTKSDPAKLTIFLRIFPLWESKGNDFILSTRLYVEKTRWDEQKKSIKGTSLESNRLNHNLVKLETNVHQLFEDYYRDNPKPNSKEFKKHLNFKLFNIGSGAKNRLLTSDLFNRYIDMHGSDLGKKRSERYKFIGTRVNEFNTIYFKTEKVELVEINMDWYRSFKGFMKKRYNYNPSTLNGYLKVLRASFKYACESGYLESFPFKATLFEKEVTTIKYLTQDELDKILRFNTQNERLQIAADCFVFATQTGLAYADLKSLRKCDLSSDKKGNPVIIKPREKTSVKSYILLNNLAQNILNKYRFHPKLKNNDLLLPMIYINDYNKLLKTIAIYCGIEKNISSHVARHTFATTVWIENDGTLETLQKVLGHDKIQTTAKYGFATDQKAYDEALKVHNNQENKSSNEKQ